MRTQARTCRHAYTAYITEIIDHLDPPLSKDRPMNPGRQEYILKKDPDRRFQIFSRLADGLQQGNLLNLSTILHPQSQDIQCIVSS